MTDRTLYPEVHLNIRQSPRKGDVKAGARVSFAGDNAHREISSRLRGHPEAQQLSHEIYEFYGNYLSYIESGDFTSTLYVINLQHDPIGLKSAEIQLQLGTARIAEALVHELLHLRLLMLGFPFGELVKVPLELDPYARTYLGMCQWVVNLVHHEMNFQRFIALGFQRRHFLAKHVAPKDYRRLFKTKPENVYAEEVDFPRWCIEYVRYLFTDRHGGGNDYLRYAQEALDWGSRYHPELEQTAAEIDRWFETGAFKDPLQYPRQVNLLLELMRIPRFVGWVILESSEPKEPIAVRLDAEGAYIDGRDKGAYPRSAGKGDSAGFEVPAS